MSVGEKASIAAVLITGLSLIVAMSLWFGRLNSQIEGTMHNVAEMERRRSDDHDVLVRMEAELRGIREAADRYFQQQIKRP